MKFQTPPLSALLGYIVSSATMTVGILVLLGLFLPITTPGQLRVTFGVVLLLLGIYRASITHVRSSQSKGRQHG